MINLKTVEQARNTDIIDFLEKHCAKNTSFSEKAKMDQECVSITRLSVLAT